MVAKTKTIKTHVVGISRMNKVCHYILIFRESRAGELFDATDDWVDDDRLDFTVIDQVQIHAKAFELLNKGPCHAW